MTSRAGSWIRNTISMMLAVSTLACCSGSRKVCKADPAETGMSPEDSDEVTRSIYVDQGRLGLDQTLQVRPSKTAAPHELHDGDEVHSGDRIRATVVTSEDAHLYLAFCSGHELAIYPSQGGVSTQAGVPKTAPEGSGELVVDGVPGPEVLYVIVSRAEISLADPRLAAKLAEANQAAHQVDCGAGTDADFTGPGTQGGSASSATPPSTGKWKRSEESPKTPKAKVLRGERFRKKPKPAPAKRRVSPSIPGPSAPNNGGSSQPIETGVREGAESDPDFIRSPGTIVWYGVDGVNGPGEVVAADADGIAVVRYWFNHTAPASPR